MNGTKIRSILVIILGLLLCITKWGFSTIASGISWFAYPLLRMSESVTQPFTHWKLRHATIKELQLQLIHAEEQIAAYQAQLIAYKGIELHLEATEEIRHFCERYEVQKAIVARVIARTCSDDEHSITVNAGSQHGVSVDMIVVAASGNASRASCLVGRVTTVFHNYSKVMLITSKLAKIPVICATTNTQGIYEGLNHCTTGRMVFVSHLQPVLGGDIVLTSGNGVSYPAGYGVGLIRSISVAKCGLYYDIIVDPLCDVMNLTYVAIFDKPLIDR